MLTARKEFAAGVAAPKFAKFGNMLSVVIGLACPRVCR